MDTKLTIKLDQQVIEKAKGYAKKQHTSLSRLIENYLKQITTSTEVSDREITPLVRSLSGIIDLPTDHKGERDYGDYLNKKYQ
jgi:hypothetical protein